jgi:hypothetical protein
VITNGIVLRWFEVDIINLAADGACPSSRSTLFQQIKGHIHQDGNYLLALLARKLFKTLRLWNGSRKAIQHIAAAAVGAISALADHSYDKVVGDKRARSLDCLDLPRQGTIRLSEFSKNVARGDLWQATAFAKQTSLGALASSGGAHEHDYMRHFVYRRKPGLAPAAPKAPGRAQKPLVVSHNELGFYLRDSVHCDAYENKKRGPAKIELVPHACGNPA